MKIAFIGLGTMGYPMAGHLQQNGANVTVYNRTMERALQWQNHYSGQYSTTAKAACKEAEFVMICVGNDDDLRSICYAETGVLAGLRTSATVIDHTTTSSDVAIEVALRCRQQGNEFLDAPVSGGEVGAINGELSIMVGGSSTIYETARPVLDHYAKQVSHLGEVGAGQTCKMVNQLCIAGILQGLSEGLSLAQESGLNLLQVRDVLKHGAAQSWQLEHRAESICEDQFDFGFAVDWMRKDLDICLNQAETLGLELPLAKLVDRAYLTLQNQGYGRADTSVLIKSIQKK